MRRYENLSTNVLNVTNHLFFKFKIEITKHKTEITRNDKLTMNKITCKLTKPVTHVKNGIKKIPNTVIITTANTPIILIASFISH